MRLHRLELTAFGPFAATQTVDFDELSAAGLFLLHGPTGSGKTSVLDGVCYALYGQVPGARPVTRLRSDHATAATATEVVLELTIGERRLEIIRRPEQPRPKKRGAGTTMDKAVTLLREHKDGAWQALSKSHQEIGEEIKQLVGMSCEQFCQVVLLPQGEFATFLRATATERTALLGRLFDTRRFKAVEHWLRDRKQEAAGRLAAGDRGLGHLAERMRQAAGGGAGGLPPGTPEDGAGGPASGGPVSAGPMSGGPSAASPSADEAETPSPDGLLEWAAVLRCDAREAATIAGQALRYAEAAHRVAASDFDAARDLHTLQARHAEARRRAAALDGERDTRAAARDRLARAHRAATVEPALGLREKTALQHREAVALEQRVLTDLTAAGELPPAVVVPRGREPLETPVRQTPGSEGRGTRSSDRRATEPAERQGGGRADRQDTGRGGQRTTGPAEGQSGRPADGPQAGLGEQRSTGPVEGQWTEPADRRRATLGQQQSGAPAEPQSAIPASAGAPPTGSVVPAPWRAEVLAHRAGELREELGGLAQAGAAEARVREIAERRAVLDREERADEGAVREADGWLEEWPALRSALQSRAEGAAEAATRAAGLAAELETARRRRDAAGQRDRLAGELSRAQDRARDARDRAAQARETWQDLRQARIDGIAAELAEQLTDGEPCRVCGSPEHPAPARPAAQQVTRADEDAAGAAHEHAAAGHESARVEADRIGAALETAAATAGDEPLARLAAACAVLEAEHSADVREAADVSEARRALEGAEQERDRRTAQRHAAQSRIDVRTSRREELDAQQQRLSADLDRARAGYASVADRRTRLSARIALLDRAAHAVRDRGERAQRLAEADAALAEAAARAGFAAPSDAGDALLDPERLWRAERQAEAWAKEEAAVEADLGAPEPAAAAQLPPADPAAAQTALTAATDRLRAASAAESATATRCAELDRLSAQATARTRELAPARAEFDAIARLSDLASATTAQNRFRMELETYVLAARLEQVAAAAAVRLQRMSSGRYTLVHTDARGGGRAKSGLGLMVVDAWTGTERDTATLSGGETFFASLALALGLADVVTDEAGGARLDTLFIDEGFGSLDDQTLDEVLDVLDGLRERDRAVGIVSHVADLRHRIPAQLRVVKGRDGSSVRMRTGTPAVAGP